MCSVQQCPISKDATSFFGNIPFSAAPQKVFVLICVRAWPSLSTLARDAFVGGIDVCFQVDDVVSTEVEQTVVSLSAAKMDEVSGQIQFNAGNILCKHGWFTKSCGIFEVN